jgi:hypothetical protein
MKRWIPLLLVFPLTACSLLLSVNSQNPHEVQPSLSLPDMGDAPELTNEVWLNTDSALRLVDLRGRVVLLEMWTFG